ncbi:MAG: DUF1552 domain-containing protein [Polyangiaceae bacterium]|jgi:Protein of unknown function (DUF1552)
MSLSRRSFLRGAGVTLALPFLPSALWSRRAGAASCTPPRRFMAWFAPDGMVMPNWTPTTSGSTWALTPILAPLAPIQDKILIVTGLDHQDIASPVPAPIPAPTPNVEGCACFLNMISIDNDDAGTTRTSLDQALLPVLNAGAPPLLPTGLQIALQGDNALCGNANCNFSRVISWSDGAALPNIYDPQQVFQQMFGASLTTGAPTPANTQRASILDAVVAEAQSLSLKLSPSDRLKLDSHTTLVRGLETRLQRLGMSSSAASATGGSCTSPVSPAAQVTLRPIESSFPIMIDLMALAFECDITRAITFMIGEAASSNNYQFLIGGPNASSQYNLSQAEAANLAALTTIDTFEIAQAAALLQRLDSMIEADGQSILDHTTFYMSSEVADGQAGNHWDMPVLIAGGASGGLRVDGRHINYIPQMPFPRPFVGPQSSVETGRVFISILQAHGIMQDTFGMATGGPLPELMP